MNRRAIVVVSLLLTGCGSATSTTTKGFQVLPDKEVEIAFKETPTTTTTIAPPRPAPTTIPTTVPATTTTPSTIPPEDVYLYFVTADGRLKLVRKQRPKPVVPLEVTNDLAKPTDASLKTLVTAGMVQKVEVNKTTTVTLNPAFRPLADVEKLLLIAQLTWTLTQLRGISQVQFVVDGEVIEVPADTGFAMVVGQSDYPDRVVK